MFKGTCIDFVFISNSSQANSLLLSKLSLRDCTVTVNMRYQNELCVVYNRKIINYLLRMHGRQKY